MSSDLRDLYQELILDHQRRPRNYRRIDGATHMKAGINPLCGDSLVLYVDVADGVVRDVSFEGSGCAISKASASMLTERLRGRTVAEAESVFSRFHHMLTEGEPTEADGEWLFECVVESEKAREVAYHFVMAHEYDDGEHRREEKWTH